MKPGAESRKKTIVAGALAAMALCCLFYAYNALFGGSSTPPPTIVSVAPSETTSGPARPSRPSGLGGGSNASAPGVDALKLASTSAGLDPTLDDTAMTRTENLVYSGSGRNIFSVTDTPPPPSMPRNVPPPRPKGVAAAMPVPPPGPLPPPPINLKFFGTAKRSGGDVQAFLLSGEDVFLASAGEIVAHKYRIVVINVNSIQVQDLQNNNTQTLPLQTQ
jgi:hypothetical protein